MGIFWGYSDSALAQSSAGFDIPTPSAKALTRSAFFAPVFYGGRHGGSSERRFSERYVNPVTPATQSLDIDGGGSLTSEDHIMALRTTSPFSFRPCDPEQTPLFSVRDGIPLDAALEMAGSILSSARDAAETAGMAATADAASIWATFYLVDMALAVVNAAISAPMEVQS
jgi:hypothetical protein